jgi:hypothetical protein
MTFLSLSHNTVKKNDCSALKEPDCMGSSEDSTATLA